MPSDKYRLDVQVDPVRAKRLVGINFEQVHAELMAALDEIAAAKGTAILLRSHRLVRRSRFLIQRKGPSNSSMSHLSPIISTS
jgi:hypothetical protein